MYMYVCLRTYGVCMCAYMVSFSLYVYLYIYIFTFNVMCYVCTRKYIHGALPIDVCLPPWQCVVGADYVHQRSCWCNGRDDTGAECMLHL